MEIGMTIGWYLIGVVIYKTFEILMCLWASLPN